MKHSNKEVRIAFEKVAIKLPSLRGIGKGIGNWFGKTKNVSRFRRGLTGAGLLGAGAGAGAAGYKYGPKIISDIRGKTVEYTDRSKSRIRWRATPNVTIVGPTSIMKNLFATGKRNRNAGVKKLIQLLKQGVIRREN